MAHHTRRGYTGPITFPETIVSGKFGEKYYDLTLNALRIVAGLLFMTHGGMKLFGWFGAQGPMSGIWPFGVAGVLEFFGRLFFLCFIALLIYFPPRMFYLAEDINRRRTWLTMLLANSPVIIRVLIGTSSNSPGW